MASVFTFKSWEFDTKSGHLDFFYHDSKYGGFQERFIFPEFEGQTLTSNYNKRKYNIDNAIEQLFWMVGVSYYKTQLADKLQFEGQLPAEDQAAWLTQTWQSGLAELAYENELGWLDQIKFPYNLKTQKNTYCEQKLKPRSLVAIGGGKDSMVSIEFLKQQREELCLFMVGNSVFIQSVAEQTACQLIQVKRQFDSGLKKANDAGAFNGHVPITAINSCVASISALLYDFDAIVFSNERSADVGNVQTDDGQWVNHQYSKSFEFEQAFQNLIHSYLNKDLSCFSLLRPFSELAIVKQFSLLTQYFPYFSSCNRNFHLAGSQNKSGHWCGSCPKCAFVFLMLAPFISKQQLEKIFDGNLLDNGDLLPLYKELLGLEGIKPFECVGEVEESLWALNQLIKAPDWQDVQLIKYFSQGLNSVSKQDAELLFLNSDLHQIPEKRNFKIILDVFLQP